MTTTTDYQRRLARLAIMLVVPILGLPIFARGAEPEPVPPNDHWSAETKSRMFDWREADHARAGWPLCQRWLSLPANTPRYGGYPVGGSAVIRGEAPRTNEGTWGWDYRGFVPKSVGLNWQHEKQRAGGRGTYPTDGPKLTR